MFKLLADLINSLFTIISGSINFIFGLFPTSPFTMVQNSQFANFIAQINYFVPIYEVIAILQAWGIAIGVYYVHSVWARWIKAID